MSKALVIPRTTRHAFPYDFGVVLSGSGGATIVTAVQYHGLFDKTKQILLGTLASIHDMHFEEETRHATIKKNNFYFLMNKPFTPPELEARARMWEGIGIMTLFFSGLFNVGFANGAFVMPRSKNFQLAFGMAPAGAAFALARGSNLKNQAERKRQNFSFSQ